MTTRLQNYEAFKRRQTQLVQLLEQSLPLFEQVDMHDRKDTIKKIKNRVADDRFKIMIMGQFKSGKSTLINAMLGEEVLPAFATPCTAVINEVKWSDKKRAILHFKNPLPKKLPDSIPNEAKQHIKQAKGQIIPPLEIPIERLEDYVAIPDPVKDQAQSVAETPYALVELYWPLKLCQNGVEIIDSPGLNEHATRTQITVDYLSTIDAVVFVMSCHALASLSEMQVIERDIRGSGHEDIFFVCNRINQIRPRERERVRQFGQAKLADKTALSKDGKGIYFVSALDALDGRLNGDEQRLNGSGIPEMEGHLEDFLVHDRGKVKLLQPARELTKALKKAAHENIPAQLRMLDEDRQVLEKRYNEAKPRLTDTEHRREQIIGHFNTQRSRLRNQVHRQTESQLRELTQKLPKWAEEFQPKNEVKFLTFESTKSQIEVLAKEVMEHLKSRIEEEQSLWTENELEPLIKETVNKMRETLDEQLKKFIKELDHVKADITGIEPKIDEEHEVSGLERILAATGGWLIAGPGAALVGGTFGYGEMLKSLVPQIGLLVGLVFVVGVTNPWLLLGALFTGGSIQAIIKTGSITNTVKKKVAEGIKKQIGDNSSDIVEKIVDEIDSGVKKLAEALDEGMTKELQEVRDQVEAVLAETRKGEAAVDAKKKKLETVGEAIVKIDETLTDFTFALSGLEKKAA